MLDRYKKKSGFIQLLNLIETSGGKKQEQFLRLISQESPAWEAELKKKMLTVERVFSWPPEVMSEVLSRLQPLTLCVSLWGKAPTDIDKILSPLPPISKRKLIDQMAELNPSPAEKSTCEMKLITEVRAIAASGYIKFEKFDADLFVEETIEERLNNSDSGIAYLSKIELNYSEETPSKGTDHKENAAPSHVNHSNSGAVSGQEVDLMKRKVAQMAQEVAALKHENQILKDKLAQIKKIA